LQLFYQDRQFAHYYILSQSVSGMNSCLMAHQHTKVISDSVPRCWV